MGNTTTNGTKVSFANTPQAGDDIYAWTEDSVLISQVDSTHQNVVTLNVMANDLGGNAKSLFSIDDGNGHTNIADYDLLNADSNGVWESTASGDSIRIFNGQIQLDLTHALAALGASNVNALAAGDHIHEQFVYAIKLGNGTLSQASVTVDIQGLNDAATITGNASGAVVEAGGVNNGDGGTPSTSGQLTVVDPDHGQSVFQAIAPTALIGAYGSFTFDSATGAWTYTLDQAKADPLQDGQHVSDTLTVTSLDGTASRIITVDIAGKNDAAVVSGTVGGDVTEAGGVDNGTAGVPTASATLTDTDVDNPANTFIPVAAGAASDLGYGTFAMTSGGTWTYTLDDTNAAVQALNTGGMLTDTFTVQTADGTAQQISVTIHGANDAATVSGTVSGEVTEAGGVDNGTAGVPTASATLTDTDVDNPANTFIPVAAGAASDLGYGTFAMTSGGTWTYTLDDTNAAVQALNTGGMLTDTFTVQTADGTAQQVSVTIHGANDAATISGTTSGSVIEAGAGNGGGTPTATGTLHDTDVDNTPNSFQAVASGASDHGYGTFSILQNGKWTYTLDNANADVNALNTGDTLNDTFTVHTQDGTAQQVSITINGTTDDQGGPTGISFALNGNASPSLNNLGTFTATGDPDGANDSFTWSAAGSSAGISIKPDGTLDASGAAAGDNVLNVQVTDQAGNAFLQAYHVWVGTGANDTFSFALSGSVIADGLNGTDTITGGSGIDHLLGGNGADKLTGGGGADQLAGQGGADTFAYLAVSDSTPAAHDTILDFTAGGGNHDVISFLNALGLTAFDGQIAGSTLAGGHVGWKEAGGETVVYANTSGASETLGATNMEIHLSGTGLGLGTNDFLLHA